MGCKQSVVGRLRSHRTYFIASLAMVASMCLMAVTSTITTSTASAASGNSPFRVLMIDGLSGGFQPIGEANLVGFKAAIKLINAKGGIDGHHVVLTTKDDQGSPQVAINVLQAALASGPKPNLVYAGGSSTENLALLPTLTRDKILSVEQGGSTLLSNGNTYPYNYTTAPLPTFEYGAIGNFFLAKGVKSVGILSSDDALGASEIALMKPEFAKLDISYTIQQYSDTALDMTPQIQALKAANAKGLVIIGYGTPIPHILSNISTIGWNVPVVGNLAVAATPLTTLVPASQLSSLQLIALELQKYKPLSQQTPGVAAGLRAILAGAGGKLTQPIYTYSLSYDAIELMAAAGNQAKSINTATLVNALNHLKHVKNPPYISLPVMTFTPTNHAPSAPPQDYFFAPATSPVKDGMFTQSS